MLQRLFMVGIFVIAAGVVLVVGLLRVSYFEKGATYYFANAFFFVKFAAFIIAALISIYPTVLFLSWSKALQQGVAPNLSQTQTLRVRMCLMWERTAIAVEWEKEADDQFWLAVVDLLATTARN